MDYLYYRLYKYIKKGSLHDIAPFATIIHLSLIEGLNLISLYTFCRKLDFGLPDLLFSKYMWIILLLTLVTLNYVIYMRKNRGDKVILKYKHESKKQRIIGVVALVLLVLFTFVFIGLIGLYKPGVM
jgi:hypothetical protein